uniref:GTPase IMAP family member 1 n=1 Tax=Magallana gigas TaxID=29159 RepID=K1PKU4_MAGGI|eukprot:XP_011431833.1 PREDICTED: hyaluronan mediated motility receptor [Crassostrea gigas]
MDHIKNSPPILRQFIQKCGGRVCAFNNKASGEEQDTQIEELLQKISENIANNGGKCYTNEMYLEAEKQIKIKEKERLAKEKEKREKELQSIKEVIAENYDKQLAQERKNLYLVQKRVNDLVKNHNKNNNRIADLQSQISLYEQMIKEKRGDQQELKQTLDLMCAELAKNQESALKATSLIEQYRRDMETSQEEKERLKREHDMEKQNLQREYEEHVEAAKEKIRDDIREHMDKEFEEYKRRHGAEMAKKKSRESKDSSCTIL